MIARLLAIAIAVAAILDPAVPVPASASAAIRVVPSSAPIGATLASAGFTVNPGSGESATVLVTDRIGSALAVQPNTWILDTSISGPNVRLASVAAATGRLPGQAVEIAPVLYGDGVDGKQTVLILEDGGIPVAREEHQWKGPRERWEPRLQYLAPTVASGTLRLRAEPVPGETTTADNAADVAVPPVRGPLRTLIVEGAVSWPALFVRRSLEGESAFEASSIERATKSLATRAGAPPPALTAATLAPFEVAVIGGPETLSAGDVEALRWFVEVRGGIAIFVPDALPSGRYASLAIAEFDLRVLDEPVRIGTDLLASELAVPRRLPADAISLAADPQGHAVVFLHRRGAGAVVVSGALDAWRHRGDDEGGFARFWRRTVATAAATVPPALHVELTPAIARPGDRVTITARVRGTELPPGDRVAVDGVSARAVAPATKIDDPVRLWPTAEPGVFSGEWRATGAGRVNVAVSVGSLRGDAAMTIAADAALASPVASEDLALLARAHGGRAIPAARTGELVEALKSAYPSHRTVQARRVMRSPWWSVPFAALLCVEWAIRRKRGLP